MGSLLFGGAAGGSAQLAPPGRPQLGDTVEVTDTAHRHATRLAVVVQERPRHSTHATHMQRTCNAHAMHMQYTIHPQDDRDAQPYRLRFVADGTLSDEFFFVAQVRERTSTLERLLRL